MVKILVMGNVIVIKNDVMHNKIYVCIENYVHEKFVLTIPKNLKIIHRKVYQDKIEQTELLLE